MASINNKRIEVTDGVLIPEKNEKTIFSAWRISFFGTLILLVLLPLLPAGKIRLFKLEISNLLNLKINYREIFENREIKIDIFEKEILNKSNKKDFLLKYYTKNENKNSYQLAKLLPNKIEENNFKNIISNIKDKKLIEVFNKSYFYNKEDSNYNLNPSTDFSNYEKIWKHLIKEKIINYSEIKDLLRILYSSNYLRNVYYEVVLFIPDGLLTTFQVTILAIFFSIIIGFVVGFARLSRITIINRISTIYVEIIRGIPLLMQLFYIYYAMAKFVSLPPIVSAILAMSVCYGAYISEIFRAGILSINKGQMEAALSLGLTRTQAMVRIILPQTIKVILPPIGNEFIAMLKDSSLVSIIAVADLLRRGREYASTTFYYFETYTYIALVYLILTLFFSRVIGIMEERIHKRGKR